MVAQGWGGSISKPQNGGSQKQKKKKHETGQPANVAHVLLS